MTPSAAVLTLNVSTPVPVTRTGSPQRTHLHTARTARGTLALDYLKDVTLTDTELVWRWDRKKITQRLVPTRRLPVAH